VRCHEGRALEVFDLRKNELIRRISFNGRATDLVVTPDGEQALVTLTNDGTGGLALVDLQTYAVQVLPLSAEPTRVRVTADGRVVLVLSDRAKVAWVVR
jgi:DNA-binding beta-propeller fold protein YncE